MYSIMRALLILWITSAYASAQLIAPFIYVSEPLSYDDAESFCLANYGTDLATIASMEDRWSAIEIVNDDTNTIWTGLKNTKKAGWWQFIEPEVECPSLLTGACVKFWRNGEPRCHKEDEDGFECAAFYVNQNYIDNNINCNAKRPFLCNQQYEYTFGSELPTPGDIFEIEDELVTGYIKIGENVTYLHQAHTLQCIIEYDEEDNVAQDSFVEITIEMYQLANVDVDSVLLVTGPIFNLLPSNCTQVPALKVIDVNVISNSVVLYVRQAALFEYITEMDIDGKNFTLQGNGEEEPLQIPNPEEEFAANNITNGSFIINTLACAVYDQDGFLIEGVTEEPVNGKCNGASVIDDYGGVFGDGFNTNTDRRRRLGWGSVGSFFKKATNWVVKTAKKVVKTVKKVVRVVVGLITGNLNERIFESGINIDEKVQYEISGTQKIKQVGKLSVSVIGTFKMQAGVKFIFTVYADLKAKYKLWSLNPSFDYFKFELGARNEFDAYVNLQIQGGVRISYKLFEKAFRKFFMLGPVPVLVKLHANTSVGVDIKLDLVMSKSAGYEPLFMKFGVEYIKGSGWKKISDSNLNLVPRKKFGGEVEDSKSCFKFTVEPWVALVVGIEFYEIVDVYLKTTASFPTAISYPATCDSTSACDHSPHQLKFGISFTINLDLGLSVGISSIGLTVAGKLWDIWDKTWPLANVCTDLELPALVNLCCIGGSTSTTTTTTTTLSPSCDAIWDYDVMGQASLVNNGGCPSGPCHQVAGRIYKKSGKCYKALTGCYACLPSASSYPQHLQEIMCNPCIHSGEYKVGPTNIFADANKYCLETYGTTLATIKSSVDRTKAQQVLQTAGVGWAWVGLNDVAAQGTWVWVDSTDCSYAGGNCKNDIYWNPGEPTGGSERCVYMNTANAVYNDNPCSQTPSTLCNYKPRDCSNPLWQYDTSHTGQRPNCPNSEERSYEWHNLEVCKSWCVNSNNCNVLGRNNGDTGNGHCFFYACPDMNNVQWVTRTDTTWGKENGNSYLLTCNSVAAHAYIGNDIIPVNDENNNFLFYLLIVALAVLVNISVCLLLYWFWLRPRNNKLLYHEVKVINEEIEMEEMDL